METTSNPIPPRSGARRQPFPRASSSAGCELSVFRLPGSQNLDVGSTHIDGQDFHQHLPGCFEVGERDLRQVALVASGVSSVSFEAGRFPAGGTDESSMTHWPYMLFDNNPTSSPLRSTKPKAVPKTAFDR